MDPRSSITTAAIHWGTPSPRFQERATTTVYCHGYAELPLEIDGGGDEYVESPDFLCLGHRWNLRIYPAQDDTEYVQIWLMSKETDQQREWTPGDDFFWGGTYYVTT
jgi:hypothetical protein